MNTKTTPEAPGYPAGPAGASTSTRNAVNPDAPPVYSLDPLGANSVAGNNVGGRPVEAPVPDEVAKNMEKAAERAGVDEKTGQPVDEKKSKK